MKVRDRSRICKTHTIPPANAWPVKDWLKLQLYPDTFLLICLSSFSQLISIKSGPSVYKADSLIGVWILLHLSLGDYTPHDDTENKPN